MNIKILKKDNIIPPENAHESDTGYDITAVSNPIIIGSNRLIFNKVYWENIDYIEYDTELQISPEIHRELGLYEIGYTLVFPRSSLSKYNLLLANSVAIIDNSYLGNIKLRFKYIIQPKDYIVFENKLYCSIDENKIYHKNEKIGQLVAMWKEDIEWEIVDSLKITKRNDGGFGSTDMSK